MKQLLNYNKRILKGLHDEFAIDFQDEVIVKEVQLPKTINAIIKENQEMKNNNVNLLLIQDRHREDMLYVVSINAKQGTYDINNQCSYSCGLNNFYSKKDFEEHRKNKDLKAFVIIGNKKGLTYSEKFDNTKKEFLRNHTVRAKYNAKDVIMGWSKDYYTRVNQVKVNNVIFSYMVGEIGYSELLLEKYCQKATGVIDKSGYNVFVKSQNLWDRAKQLRASREMSKLQLADFTRENNEIKQRINNLYAKIIATLSNMAILNVDKIQKVSSLLNYNYLVIVSQYKKHLDKLNKAQLKTDNENIYYQYANIKDVKNVLQEINNKIDTTLNKLQEIML